MKQKPELRSVSVATLLLFWIPVVIAFYYVVHKPWVSSQPISIIQAFRDIIVALALIGLSGGLGVHLIHRFIVLPPLENLAVSASLGLGVLSLIILLIGMVGCLYTWLAWIILIFGLLLFRTDVLAWFRLFRELSRNTPALSRFEFIAAFFLLLLMILNLFRSLAPPVKWDSLVYHLEIPRQYLASGRILFLPENFYAGFPQLVELLFTWAMALGSTATAATLGWVAGVVTLIGVEGFSRRFTAPGVRFLAPAILLTGFSISQSLNWAYVDIWIMLFGLGFFICLEQFRTTVKRRYILLAGVMAGLAIGGKYTAGILLPIGATELFFIDLHHGNHRRWGDILWLSLVAFLVVSPWLVKNWILTRNPAYPFINFDSVISPWQQSFRSGPMPERSLVNDFLLPIDITLFSIESSIVVGKPEYSASLGPLFLALIPGLLAGRKTFTDEQWNGLKLLLIVVMLTWLLWAGLSHLADELMRPRHYFGVYPVLAVLATAGFQSASSLVLPGVRLRRVLVVIVSLALLLATLTEVYNFVVSNPLSVVMGVKSEMEYVRQELGSYGDVIEEINALPETSIILFLWEPRVLYCKPSCIMDAKLDNWWALRRATDNYNEIAFLLHQRDVSYVLINEGGIRMIKDMGLLNIADIQILDLFRREWLNPWQVIGNSYTLYELNATIQTNHKGIYNRNSR